MAEPVVTIAVPQRGSGFIRHLTPRVEGTTWTDEVRGCGPASFTVLDPMLSSHLTQDCKVVISDPASGEVLWTGQISNAPDAVQRSPLGASATVQCVGNSNDTMSTYWSLPYIVRDYREWQRETLNYRSHRNWDTSTGARPMDPPWDSVVMQIDQGKGIYPGFGGRMAYLGHMGSDMWIGSFRCLLDSGTAQHPQVSLGAPSYLRTVLEYGNRFYHGTAFQVSWSTTAATIRRQAGGTGWPDPPDPAVSPSAGVADSNYLILATEFTDSAGYEVTNENVWVAASQVVVCGARVDRHGAAVGSLTEEEMDGRIRAGDIFEDLVGRCLRGIVDPREVEIQMDTWRLTQADYREQTAPGEIGDDMMLVHPDHLWRIGRRSPTTGLAPFWWRLWEDKPRFVIDTARAEVDIDRSPDTLFNRVNVGWVDWKNRPRSATFVADPVAYPDIADLQGVHSAPPVELDATLGEWETVQRIGAMMLDQVARRVPAGTITVTEPVLDTVTQQMVPPSQLLAATTCALTADEPLITHRIREATHEGTDVVTLSVGRPRLTLDQIVATRGRRRR
ncbi:hypothetical protein [Janibacter terrae]|uniref:hypothetical protein n=1 Tax=Janibacter terrae TaxID=103817 RepID=UPI0031F7B4C1